MGIRRSLLWGAVAALASCSAEDATLLRVRVIGASAIASVTSLEVTVFGDRGLATSRRVSPPGGRGTLDLPRSVDIFPPRPGTLRLLVSGYRGAKVIGQGTATAVVQVQQTTDVAVTLSAGTLPDRDGDGVPDAIDSCARQANPDQDKRCSAGDAGLAGDGPAGDGGGVAVDTRPRSDRSTPGPDATVRRDAPPADKGGSGSTLASVQLSGTSSCTSQRVVHVDSVRVALYAGSTLRKSRCIQIANNPSGISAIAAALPKPLLTGLSAGSYLLLLTGHDNGACAAQQVLICGGVNVTIPVSGAPKLQLSCVDETSPSSIAACRSSVP